MSSGLLQSSADAEESSSPSLSQPEYKGEELSPVPSSGTPQPGDKGGVDATTPRSSSSLSQRGEAPSRTKSILRFGRNLRTSKKKQGQEQEQKQVAEAERSRGQELDPTRTRSRSTQRSIDSQRSKSSAEHARSTAGAAFYRDSLLAAPYPRASTSSSKGDSSSDPDGGTGVGATSGERASSELDSVAWRSSQSLPRESSIEEEEWEPSETLGPAKAPRRLMGSLGRRQQAKQAMAAYHAPDEKPDTDTLRTPRSAASAAQRRADAPVSAPTCNGATPVASRPTSSSIPSLSASTETTAASTLSSRRTPKARAGLGILVASPDDDSILPGPLTTSTLASSTPASPLSESSRHFASRTSRLHKGSSPQRPQLQPPAAPLPPLPPTVAPSGGGRKSLPSFKASEQQRTSLERPEELRDLRTTTNGSSTTSASSSSGGPGSRIASRFMSKLKGTHLDDEIVPVPKETLPPTRNVVGVGSFVNPFIPPLPSTASTQPSGDMRPRVPPLPGDPVLKVARKTRSQSNLKVSRSNSIAQPIESGPLSASSSASRSQTDPPTSAPLTSPMQVSSEDSSLQKKQPRRSTRRPRTSGGDIGQSPGPSLPSTSAFGSASWFQRKISGPSAKEPTSSPPNTSSSAWANTMKSRLEMFDSSPEDEKKGPSFPLPPTSFPVGSQRDVPAPLSQHIGQIERTNGDGDGDDTGVPRRMKLADRGRSSSVNSLDDFGQTFKSKRGPAAGSHLANRKKGSTPSRPSSSQGIEVGQGSKLDSQGGAASLFGGGSGGGGSGTSSAGGTPRQRASSLLPSMPWRSRTNSNAGTDQESDRRVSTSPQQQQQQQQQPQSVTKRASVTTSTAPASARQSTEVEFNYDPEAFLEHVLNTTPNTELASKLASSSSEMHKEALRLFMQRFYFSGYAFDIALRKLLMSLCLPKETQQIDRVMEAFARRYNECNERLFVNDDQPYILAFSLMMLHTDTFNRNAKTKMSKADYIRNTATSGVATEVLEYLYDNLTFTQFIYVEEEDEKQRRASDANDAGGSTKLFSALSSSSALTNKTRIDPYYIISNQGDLEKFRPASILQLIPEDSPFSPKGTASRFDIEALNRSFVCAPSIEIITARRAPPAGLAWGGESYAHAVMTTSLVAEEDPDSVVTLRVTKVGCISRKDDIVDNKKKSQSRKWKTWGLMLSSSQLLFFRDLVWTSALDQQIQEQTKDGKGDKEGGVLITPRITYFRPDDVLGLSDAIAVRDSSYDKYNHVFRLIAKQGNQICQYLVQTPSERDMNDWIHKINFCATFRSLGITIRGLDPPATSTSSPDFGADPSITSSSSTSTSIDSRRVSDATMPGPGTPKVGMTNSPSHDSGLSRFLPPSPSPSSPGEGGMIPLVGIMRRRLNARRREMFPKIDTVTKNLEKHEKQLDDKLRLARHLAITTPFQKVTRERIELVAVPLADEIRTLRIEVARFRSRREMLMLELEAGDKAARATAPAASFMQSGWTKAEAPMVETSLPPPMLSTQAQTPSQSLVRRDSRGRGASQSIAMRDNATRRQDLVAAAENGISTMAASAPISRSSSSPGKSPALGGAKPSESGPPSRRSSNVNLSTDVVPRDGKYLRIDFHEEEEELSSGADGSGSNSDRKVSTSSWSSNSASISESGAGIVGGVGPFPLTPTTPSAISPSVGTSDAKRFMQRKHPEAQERDDVVDWNQTKMASTHNKRISLAMLPSSNELHQQLQERIGQHQHQHQERSAGEAK